MAGKIAAATLTLLEHQVQQKTTASLIELNKIAEEFILESGGLPTFKGYKGFPAGVCISVNSELVHGIPTDRHLQEGDVVSFDLGVTYCKAIADTAITCIYGQPKSERHVHLVKSTEQALQKGIEALIVGKRLGCVGQAVNKYSKQQGFGVVTKYGGHGLSWNVPHDEPFVANQGTADEGIHVQPGLSIAIEPMLVIGDTYTWVGADGWTVYCDGISAHFEHSVTVGPDGTVEVITQRSQ